jgi:SAM-dependent methyltransferase
MPVRTILEGYAEASAELIPRFEAISTGELYAPVSELLPPAAARILDIGAGTGRDAAWLAERGHQVLAVEPVDGLRRAGMALHPGARIEWLDDTLPQLSEVLARGPVFDRVFVTAVWQHLRPEERRRAMPNLATVTAPGGFLILSLRHGPGSPARPCFDAAPEDTIDAAAAAGLRLALRRAAPSIQARNRDAGVTWTWLAFRPL